MISIITFSDNTNIPRSGSMTLEQASVTNLSTQKKHKDVGQTKLCIAEIGHCKDMLSPMYVIAW